MNKLIWIALTVLLVVGISYQAKRVYDSRAGTSNGITHRGFTQNGTLDKNTDSSLAGKTDVTSGAGANGIGTQSGNSSETNNHSGAESTATTSATHANANTSTATAKVEPEKPQDNCFAFEYRHKKEARDQDIENFLDYTNAFPIARADYNPKSLCVKVNQKAVNFQVAKAKTGTTEVRVGSMVGPESVIRVSYCVGKVSPCHETCVQPKKRFMDDLMNDAGDEDSFSDSWGKGDDDKNKQALKEKSKELRAIASENDHLNEGSVQRDWDELQKQEWVCK